MSDLLESFLGRKLTSLGAIVEPRTEGLYAVLPDDVARALGIADEALFVCDAAPQGGQTDARLGSPLFERLIAQCDARPAVAALALAAELPLPPSPDAFVLQNAIRTGDAEPIGRAPARYLQATLRLTLHSDEMRRTLLRVTVRLSDGARVSPIALASAYPIVAAPLDETEQATARRALRRAVRTLGPDAFSGALEAIARRARRDLLRIADYYRSLDGEMARAAAQARSPEERARRQDKRALLPEELRGRRAQVRERMSARLEAKLVAAAIVETEADRWRLPVRRRSLDGSVVLERRAGDGAVEGPACASCGIATLRAHLCDDALHVLCGACGRSGRLDRSRCPACTQPPASPPAIRAEDASAALHLGDVERSAR